MRIYRHVEVETVDREVYRAVRKADVIPVAIEIGLHGSVPLPEFEHPHRALYVFGPEDGSICGRLRSVCHHFVEIPSRSCLNLSTAASIVLYDRLAKWLNSGGVTSWQPREDRRATTTGASESRA